MSFTEALAMVFAAAMWLILELSVLASVTLWRWEPLTTGCAAIWAFGTALDLFLLACWWCLERPLPEMS